MTGTGDSVSLSGGVARRLAQTAELLGLLRHAGAAALAGLVAVALAQVVAPLAMAYLIGALVAALADGDPSGAFGRALGLLWTFAGVMVAAHAASALDRPLRELVVRRVDGAVRTELRHLALTAATPAELAEPDVQGDMELATKGYSSHTPGAAATAQLMLVFRTLTAVAAAAVLATFSWWVALLTLVLVLAQHSLMRRQWAGASGVRTLAVRLRPLQRRAEHLADATSGAAAGKEVRIFGLGPWLVTQFERAALARLAPLWRKRMSVMGQQWLVFGICALATVPAFVAIAVAGADRTISVAALVLHLRVTILLLSTASLGMEPFIVDFGRVSVAAHRRLVERFGGRQGEPCGAEPRLTEPRPAERRAVERCAVERCPVVAGPAGRRPDAAERVGRRPARPPLIRFDGVGFGYPNTGRDVFDGLDLEIRPGEKLAVVGLNGAGKSSLVRLLTGLESPSRGRITADGVDLASTDMRRWWRRVAVVFQSPVHFGLSVEDNVRLGDGAYPDPDPGADDDAAFDRALDRAGARDLVSALPQGAATVLSARFPGGVDISGGQWQKIALARALYAADRGADVVVLDEPTAHLDVQAELEVFRTLIETMEGRTLVLVSHRFATVRHADRIVVLAEGRIAEQGTHAELMDLDGDYAHWYRLQARLVTGPVGT
ncbi:ATP-binding cassette, subfamily B [Streptoalloteichus tenebrarius]|uniref:ATP-binding cassette, subfamily B n=1 Tax=Streptoalloteichus tenebrarius (strain ATCC 17920 / DSM 40477 / JCM 4838 / CBS 697.72 / NBRC 16177 / NCIMB 11028 / NRRL B-12390 / A12253. 1 / ISP 5477) TaxID=1933 RepID=A0ABT1HRK0_STRSD|nr:ATP-binding cassette domain-containing protein [Streptoalloteichus tenebrarius]MCP2258148.1 ATP-binding cassette, subfamily B [Streptoalloteichus tenebrarius]BFF04625.1 ABC transporter ATP-binding protein [Streptoalloteichus tenebrarius]